jgi:hypothetical protein
MNLSGRTYGIQRPGIGRHPVSERVAVTANSVHSKLPGCVPVRKGRQ